MPTNKNGDVPLSQTDVIINQLIAHFGSYRPSSGDFEE
jgi:hypothetical protein